TGTNRNTGDFVKRLIADAAFIGENQVEKAAHDPFDGVLHAARHYESASETGEQATREDPPPPKTPVYNTLSYNRISKEKSGRFLATKLSYVIAPHYSSLVVSRDRLP